MQDSFGRTIDYLRISVTDRCNLACRYCMPEGCSLEKRPVLRYEQILAIAQVAVREAGFRKIRITGGDAEIPAFAVPNQMLESRLP